MKSLQQAAELPDTGTVEERQRRFEARAAEIRGKSRSIASRSNELGKSTATEMRALAAAVSIAPNQPGFSCFDPTLSQRLRQAADQADQPAAVRLRDAAFNEAIVQAVQLTDQAERTKLYQSAQKIHNQQVPWLNIAHSTVFEPIRKEVSGYKVSPLGAHEFQNVDVAE